jgi:stearoyl-CoA desaturase (Delta-9 desaturase)
MTSKECLQQELRPGRDVLLQKIHAGAILIVPTVMTALAVIEVWREGLRAWEILVMAIGYFLTMIGITVGYHRLLAHRSFSTRPSIRSALAILGSMAAQGSPNYWVGNHRRHHQYVERDADPHTPYQSNGQPLAGWAAFWHAHVGWTFSHEMTNTTLFCRDLLRDRPLAGVNRRYYLWVSLGLVVPGLIGALIEHSAEGAWRGLLWGGGVRLFLSYHMTAAINSVTHMFGSRRFQSPDQSRNNIWLALPTLGEAWHNNHHAAPRYAIFGRRSWEFDLGGLFIRALQTLGLAWNIRGPRTAPTTVARELW